jgi:sugar-specific transcriptional regulator TrmB
MKKLLLEKLGFNPKESIVYMSLLELGPASPSEIVKKSGLHRPDVYKALTVLVDKHLVSVMPKGKYKKYVAESPEKLEKVFKDIEAQFFNEIEDLHRAYEERSKKPLITYTEGTQALTDAYSTLVHTLKKGETYYRYSSNDVLNRKSYVPKDFRKVRDEKQLERLVITNEPTKKTHRLSLGRVVKSIPKEFDLFEYNISQLIYKDKVAILDYNSKAVITIENKQFTEFQRKLFKLLFSKL